MSLTINAMQFLRTVEVLSSRERTARAVRRSLLSEKRFVCMLCTVRFSWRQTDCSVLLHRSHSLQDLREGLDNFAPHKAIEVKEAVKQESKEILQLALLLTWFSLVLRVGDFLD